MKKKIIIMSLSMLLLVGCGNPKLKDGSEVVASMNNKNITAEDLYEALKEKDGADTLINLVDTYIADTEHPTTDEITNKVNEQYEDVKKQNEEYYQVDFKTILENYGYTEESYKKLLTTSYKQELLVKDYIRSLKTDEDVKKYYEENMYGKITARHILIMPKKTEDMSNKDKEKKKKDAYDLAVSLIKRLDKGENFADLAKEFSEDTVSAENGGLLEPFDNNSGFVTEFWEASKALEVGKYSKKPVESQYGYHIILKESEEERPSLEDKKEEILDKLVDADLNGENSSKLISEALVYYRKKYNLDIKDSNIKDIYNKSIESTNE